MFEESRLTADVDETGTGNYDVFLNREPRQGLGEDRSGLCRRRSISLLFILNIKETNLFDPLVALSICTAKYQVGEIICSKRMQHDERQEIQQANPSQTVLQVCSTESEVLLFTIELLSRFRQIRHTELKTSLHCLYIKPKFPESRTPTYPTEFI